MTDCQKILTQLEVFLDQELNSDLCAEIERHLAGCTSCSDRAEFRVHLKALVAAKCGCEEAPQQLVERVMLQLDVEQPTV